MQQCLQDSALCGGDGIEQGDGLVAHKVITADFPLFAGSAERFRDDACKYLLMLVDAALDLREIEVGGAALTIEAVGLCKWNTADQYRCGVEGFAQRIGETDFGLYRWSAGDGNRAKADDAVALFNENGRHARSPPVTA